MEVKSEGNELAENDWSNKPPSVVSKLKPQLMVASGRSSPNSSEAGDGVTAGTAFRDMIERIYSRDEDEDEDSRMSAPNLSEDEDKFIPQGVKTEFDTIVTVSESVVHPSQRPNGIKFEPDEMDAFRPLKGEPNGIKFESDEVNERDKTEFDSTVTENKSAIHLSEPNGIKLEPEKMDERPLKREPTGPPPWDQPLLTPDIEERQLWSLVCNSIEDWRQLCETLRQSTSKIEKELRVLLEMEFLPEMEKLYADKVMLVLPVIFQGDEFDGSITILLCSFSLENLYGVRQTKRITVT